MRTLTDAELEALIKECLNEYYTRRLDKLKKLQLRKVLKRKNPYLFRALGAETPGDIVTKILEAYVSSSDETIFGKEFFEEIATRLPDVQDSEGKGCDLTMVEATAYRVYALKSGTHPFNSSAKAKQNNEFLELRSRLAPKIKGKEFDPVLAYSYGNKNMPANDKRIYRESAGQEFWKEITGDDDFYLKLMRLMKNEPQARTKEYKDEWNKTIQRFTNEFAQDFCTDKGQIDWEKLTKYVSAKEDKAENKVPKQKNGKKQKRADK